MSRQDLSNDDLEGLLASHESREQAKRVLDNHRLPSGHGNEGAGGMGALAIVATIVVGIVLYNVPALARLVVGWFA